MNSSNSTLPFKRPSATWDYFTSEIAMFWIRPFSVTQRSALPKLLASAPRVSSHLVSKGVSVLSEILVPIDIEPGDIPNSINLRSKGTIPVAILSSPTFDAPGTIDFASLTFGRTGTEKSLAFCNSHGEDVNGDGLLDLVCHFNTQQTGFRSGDTQGVLQGNTLLDFPIRGVDSVHIVK